jgi:hypothetical protein
MLCLCCVPHAQANSRWAHCPRSLGGPAEAGLLLPDDLTRLLWIAQSPNCYQPSHSLTHFYLLFTLAKSRLLGRLGPLPWR